MPTTSPRHREHSGMTSPRNARERSGMRWHMLSHGRSASAASVGSPSLWSTTGENGNTASSAPATRTTSVRMACAGRELHVSLRGTGRPRRSSTACRSAHTSRFAGGLRSRYAG